MGTSLRRCLAASMFLLIGGAPFGQTSGTGAIPGTIYDPANRVVVSADVQAVSDGKRLSRSVTSSEGVSRVPLSPPGAYTVTVQAPRFAAKISQPVQVTVSEPASLNVALAIDEAGENEKIEARAASAQSESSTVRGAADETAILPLPLASRNYPRPEKTNDND